MNSPDDLVFNLSTPPSTHDETLVSLEPVKKTDSQRRSRRDPRRRRSRGSPQVFFHNQALAVLCLRDHSFTLTNGVVSYGLDRVCPNQLFQSLHYLNFGTICVTDPRSKDAFKDIQVSWSSSNPFKRIPVMLLNPQKMGECTFCYQTQCHRLIAVQGMCAILRHSLHPLFHS
ncbi:hypothetical protein TNCV_2135421 [Trichonephila clavipes]|nr:hypothetical protein TNCV_2135421 [Trichonephila clavipes]